MDFWHHVLSTVQKHTNRQCFDTWFRPISYQGRENGILKLAVPTEIFKNCLLENYSDLLLRAAGETAKAPVTLQITVESATASDPVEPLPAGTPPSVSDSQPLLIPKY